MSRNFEVNDSGSEVLFLTEILNDLYRNGWMNGNGKAATMLKDWKAEFERKSNFPKSKLRKVFNENVGFCNW
jgi:hypothetical protein